jgi:hypothetical protein
MIDMTERSVRFILVVPAFVASFMSACMIVRSDVTRFDRLPSDTAGATVVFVPLDEQKTSVAHQFYVDRVAAELAKHGMIKTDQIAEADYAVVMACGLGGRRQGSGAVPVYGQTGGGSTFHSGSMSASGTGGRASGTYSGMSHSAPTYGIIGTMPFVRTEHDRYFAKRMIDVKRSTAENPGPVYEGTVLSTGNRSSFDQVAGCMLSALFEEFRQSGSDRVHVAAADCG